LRRDQAEFLRRVALKDGEALELAMRGRGDGQPALDQRCAALVRIVSLASIDSDASTFEWAVDMGVAAGLDDESIFDALLVIAPIIGLSRLTSSLPHVLAALDIDLIED
jgi:alkylhydroperoxidase/carboxymuconolactone decarboxylase family protein YurZ